MDYVNRIPLPEYPRPQMVRKNYVNLNGVWDLEFSTDGESFPKEFSHKILVPFSPETKLSGVMKALSENEFLWYTRKFTLNESSNPRCILHFGAVDQECAVYINGTKVGCHIGGYNAFSFDITDYVNLAGENSLAVCVKDVSDKSYHSRGKQKTKRGGIWYTPQSGIWQTVWLECVPQNYVKNVKITPLFDDSAVEFVIDTVESADGTIEIDGVTYPVKTHERSVIKLDSFIPWTPENPHLYNYTLTVGEDRVEGYFGMRKFSVEADKNGVKRLFLNGKPYFHTGLLDQGYWQDSLYTPPSDEAMIYDIQLAKSMGFNMLRKHIKVEPMRWYYHCDRLGMLVWQDMINGGSDDYKFLIISTPLVTGMSISDKHYKLFARESAEGRAQYYTELKEMILQLYNCPCIAMWVPFNEGWGQFDAEKAVDLIKSLDTTRTIDHASGWHDQHIGDFKSLHVYFRKYKFKPDKLGRAVILTEFGGYNYQEPGHSESEVNYGYKTYPSKEAFFKAFKSLYEEQIIPAKAKGLAATVYTQLSDVEDELNGLITYDREVLKVPVDAVKEINNRLTE